jgi:GTPase SAR1 family protein
MKEEIFIYFIGTAGSGKSTLAHNFEQWMKLRGLDTITVNLDPGAENLPYEPDVDIRDWVSLEDVMKTYELGPNGAQIACADMIALNTTDIKNSIEKFKPEYVILDTPGQLELFVFREAGKYILKFLNPKRSIVGYLLDPALAKTASGFASQLLLSISTNFRLGQSQINILSKSDMLSVEELDRIKRWVSDIESLNNSILNEEASIFREISEKILLLISEFENQGNIISTGVEDFLGLDDLYTHIQLQFQGGEDLRSD